MLKRA
jgi:hypothetical protein